jgi:hypothetical protein
MTDDLEGLRNLPPLLTPGEVKRILRMRRGSIINLEKAGILHPVGIRPQSYRYKRDEVLAFLELEK